MVMTGVLVEGSLFMKTNLFKGVAIASRNDDKYKIPRFPIYDSTSLTEFANLVN